MNKLEVLLKNPELSEPNDLSWIDEKIKQYPYVSSFRLLRLMALKKDDQMAFEKELPQVSYFFNDPEFISKYFKEPEAESEIQENQVVHTSAPEIENNIGDKVSEPKDKTPVEEIEVQQLENATNLKPEKPESVNSEVESTPIPNTDEESELIKNLRKLGLDHLIPDMQAVRKDASDDSLHLETRESVEDKVQKEEEEKVENELINEESIVEHTEDALTNSNDITEEENEVPTEVFGEDESSEESLNPEESKLEEVETTSELLNNEIEQESELDDVIEEGEIQDKDNTIPNEEPSETENEEEAIQKEISEVVEPEKSKSSEEEIENLSEDILKESKEVEDELETEELAADEEKIEHEELAIEPIEFSIENELEDLTPITNLSPTLEIEEPSDKSENELKENNLEEIPVSSLPEGKSSEKPGVEKKTILENEKEVPKLDKATLGNKRTFSQWLKLYQQPTIQLTKDAQKLKSEAIDVFLEKNPKISPVRTEEKDSVIDINSIMENDQQISHLMTETLAKLYVEQRKFNKAIEAYEILILKNPEKSGIFADQIEKIKNLK